MYGIKVISTLKNEKFILVGGERIGEGVFKPGMTLTDGNRLYEVIGIPFVRYTTAEAIMKNISVELKPDGFDEKELEGRTLYTV